MRGKFFQPYQFKAKLGEGPLKKFHDIFVKYLTKNELPKQGEPTNFYYFGVPAAIVTVEGFRRAGPHPTRELMGSRDQVASRISTPACWRTPRRSAPTSMSASSRMYAVGLDDKGNEIVYKPGTSRSAGSHECTAV